MKILDLSDATRLATNGRGLVKLAACVKLLRKTTRWKIISRQFCKAPLLRIVLNLLSVYFLVCIFYYFGKRTICVFRR
jgi:hypothetical protein